MSYDHCAHGIRIIDGQVRCLPCKDAEVERLRKELMRARSRTSNLLRGQHDHSLIMNPDEYLKATLSLLDAALAGAEPTKEKP